MSDLYPPVAEIDCRGNGDVCVGRYEVAGFTPSRFVLCGRFRRCQPGADRLMGNPRHIVEGGQPEGVVVVPVGDDDGGHRDGRSPRQRIARSARPCSGLDPVSTSSARCEPTIESKVHRFGFGDGHVYARSQLSPGP